MADDRLAFCFGVHNHQPVGNFEHVLEEATVRAYRPFLERLHARPEVRLTVHCTGSLLEWLRAHEPRTFDLLGALASRGQVELLTGGFYEPILAILPDPDKRGQIERLSAFLRTHFGVRPRGMWLAERVWEPHLPRALAAAGVEYVLLDDRHFALTGLDVDALGGYYLTEEQGAVLRVFPISQRLRYLIPFAEADAALAYLAERRGRVPALTMVDDGEKFGVWPGTHALVYERGWLEGFFDRLLRADWLELRTLGEVVDRLPATGRVYLPTASYREMGDWALPAEAGELLERARRAIGAIGEGERFADLLRGGFWRGFLVKYPEIADAYWKMIRLSRALHADLATAPDDARLLAAREALWRGQANDAYWHGVFGGCYLPHLRRAVKSSLLECERRLAGGPGGTAATWTREDVNGDGRHEVLVRTTELSVTLNPERGGTVTEIGYLPKAVDVADVLARRPEAYHDQVRAAQRPAESGQVRTIHDAPGAKETGLEAMLAYDDLRRGSLLDGWFDESATPLDPLAPWGAARVLFAEDRLGGPLHAEAGLVRLTLERAPRAGENVAMQKVVTVRDATLEARYRLRAVGAERVTGRWAVQWNLALSAGDAPDRYLTLEGRPSLGSAGRVPGLHGVALVDEWLGLAARLAWTPGAELAWAPVETISVSEAGFERIYQGTALLLAWPVALDPGAERDLGVTLSLGAP